MTIQTIAQWVAAQLAAWGVKAIYGVPGDAILPLLAAFEAHPDLQFYSVIHEATAAFMAQPTPSTLENWAFVLRPTAGIDLLNGLMDAKKDQAPVLALTGQVASNNLDTNYKQAADANLLLLPAVGFSGLAASCRSQMIFWSRRSARVWPKANLPTWQSRRIYGRFPTTQPVRPPEPYLSTKPQSSPAVIDGVLPLLNRAEQPAILAGRGCSGLGPLLLDFATHWESGITLTMPAKGVVPDAHPLVLGGLGPGGSEASSRMLAEADLLLIAGATWWPELYLPDQLSIVRIDAIPEKIGGPIPVTYGIVGDLMELLPRLRGRDPPKEKPHWQRRLQEWKADWQASIAPEYEATGSPVPPGRVIKAIEAAVNEDAVICLDVGDHTVWFNRLFRGTRQKVLVSGSWRSMGFGLPAALSVKLAVPERQVIAVVGDGRLSPET